MTRIENYLLEGENLENKFALTDNYGVSTDIYASNKRLFIKRGSNIRDVDYNHISSIQFRKEDYLWVTILGGIIFISSIFGFLDFIPSEIRGLLFILSLICIIIGIVYKPEFLEITAIGLPEPLIFAGDRSGLDSLFITIRKKR